MRLTIIVIERLDGMGLWQVWSGVYLVGSLESVLNQLYRTDSTSREHVCASEAANLPTLGSLAYVPRPCDGEST